MSMSSSDEEQIDSGGGVAAFYCESSATAGISASTAQASDELNVLDSFDLPKEDLQDKVSIYQQHSLMASRRGHCQRIS